MQDKTATGDGRRAIDDATPRATLDDALAIMRDLRARGGTGGLAAILALGFAPCFTRGLSRAFARLAPLAFFSLPVLPREPPERLPLPCFAMLPSLNVESRKT